MTETVYIVGRCKLETQLQQLGLIVSFRFRLPQPDFTNLFHPPLYVPINNLHFRASCLHCSRVVGSILHLVSALSLGTYSALAYPSPSLLLSNLSPRTPVDLEYSIPQVLRRFTLLRSALCSVNNSTFNARTMALVPQFVSVIASSFATRMGQNLVQSLPLSCTHAFWAPLSHALSGVS
jgi:hypothetical protein